MNFYETARSQQFVIDQLVLVKHFHAHRKHDWALSKLLKAVGTAMWLVQVCDQVWINQIIQRFFDR